MLRFLLLISLAGCASHRIHPITETLSSKRDSYRFCFLSSKDHKDGLKEGTATISFTIDPQGSPRDIKLLKTNIKDQQFKVCFLNTISNLKFTPPDNGGTVDVNQPFSFKE